MLPHLATQTLGPIAPDRRPELQRAESPAERYLPVPVVDDGPGLGGGVSKVFRQDAEGVDERLPVGYIEGVAVEVHEHPLVRIDAIAVGSLQAFVDETQ